MSKENVTTRLFELCEKIKLFFDYSNTDNFLYLTVMENKFESYFLELKRNSF